jgi:hypothetical protein
VTSKIISCDENFVACSSEIDLSFKFKTNVFILGVIMPLKNI